MKPNFIFLGPDKSGSSWLFAVLREHPQCFVPECKDIYYFDRYYDKGARWYSAFFDGCEGDELAVGELSHDYLFSADAAGRIRDDFPNATLLTILRHPVDRTWSQYLYMLRNGYASENFQDALKKYPFLISNSLYARHLSKYQDAVDSGRLTIFWFDDLVDSPTQFASKIFSCLGVDDMEIVSVGEMVRGAAQARNRLLSYAVKKGALTLRNFGAANLVGRVKHSKVSQILYRPYSKGEKPQITPNDRYELLQQFMPDIEVLEGMTSYDLSHWKS